ncbi:response regulator transcription factor [Pantoea sp. SS70]|uniref:response regulator transcription factor n=1 Tax=Pantoea sp. SS70 TaxID=3024247 RepID=UPI002452E712|nr:response regulator transcription factor [Pantoea sp. SS70]WGK60085.1 response regulator transcription factor [Pantoea sp. SS70]
MIEKNIIILDDHPIFLEGLKRLINNEPEFIVSDCCKNSRELFFSLSLAPANIALIDCSLPKGELNLKSLVEQLSFHYPNMNIVTMGDCHQQQQISTMLKPQIKSYFCKSLSPENWITGLRHISCHHCKSGQMILDDNVDVEILSMQRLSAKEKVVIEYLHAGLTVSQTALRLSRSVKTISSQKRAAMRKLGLNRDSEIFRLNMNKL